MKTNNKQTIIIIEPSSLLTQGLREVLANNPEYEVTHSFDNIEEFIENTWQLEPDIILLNPIVVSQYKPFSIRNIVKEINEAPILALLYSYVPAETLAGFDGSIEICDKPETITAKIKLALENIAQQQESTSNESIELSDREKEILKAVAKGLTNKEIADEHHISIHTVITHRKNISRKTGIKTISGLTVYAMLNNLI